LRQQVSVKYHGTVEAGLILTLIPSILVVLCVFLTRLATRARRGKIIWHFVGVGAWAGTTFLVATLMERPARWIERPDDSPYFPDLPPFPEYQLFEICDQLFKVLTFPMRWLYSDETSRPIGGGNLHFSALFYPFNLGDSWLYTHLNVLAHANEAPEGQSGQRGANFSQNWIVGRNSPFDVLQSRPAPIQFGSRRDR
jgi:hypothetical protein